MVKLLDFGLVRVQGLEELRGTGASAAQTGIDSNLTGVGSLLGTPAFMAPEQIAGEVNPRSDIYSVGTVAYFALTGLPPFERQSLAELYRAHRSETPALPSSLRQEISADLESIVMRCLSKQAADRFPGAADLDGALGSCGCATGWDAAQANAFWAAHDAPNKSEAKPAESAELPFEVTQQATP